MIRIKKIFSPKFKVMPNLPDFTPYGYQTLEILYQNTIGGRITYKAHDLKNNQNVVIKQFSFAKKTWDGYKDIEREINVLSSLNHAGIPRYFNKFDSDDGLCLVQEYINAQPLSTTRSFSAEEVKSIATQLLEILVYLQALIPPIIHRDIKPENVLVENILNPPMGKDIPPNPSSKGGNRILDIQESTLFQGGFRGIKVYLVDFGLARVGNNTMAFSSMMGGTLGFMPPEQVHNQKLTEASDLYGLGATLICLITNTQSINLGSLVDFSTNKINFKDKVPKFSLRFIQWLEKMVEPNPTNRYENAQVALDALKSLYIIRLPEVNLDKLELNFVADQLNQKLSQTITITNNIPDTILEGNWSVSPHKKDPPHTPDNHSWISFSPRTFKGNQVNCEVKVDTSKLKADKNYDREIILVSNARQENYYAKVKVKTANFLKIPLPPYQLLAVYALLLVIILRVEILREILLVILVIAIFGAILRAISKRILKEIWIKIWQGVILEADFRAILGIVLGAISGAILGAISGANSMDKFQTILGAFLGTIFGAICGGIIVIITAIVMAMGKMIVEAIAVEIYETIYKSIYKYTEKILTKNFYDRGFKNTAITFYILTTTVTSILIGVGAAFGFSPLVLTGLGVSSIPLAWRLIMPPLKLRKLKVEYRRQESQNLIDS